MPREHMVTTFKRCKRCRWSTAFHNWTPPGEPKKPDTFYCMKEELNKVDPDCQDFLLPDEEAEEAEGG